MVRRLQTTRDHQPEWIGAAENGAGKNIVTTVSRPHLDLCLSHCVFILFEEDRGGVERDFAGRFRRLTKEQAQVRRHGASIVGDASMQRDRTESGGAFGESAVEMQPRPA